MYLHVMIGIVTSYTSYTTSTTNMYNTYLFRFLSVFGQIGRETAQRRDERFFHVLFGFGQTFLRFEQHCLKGFSVRPQCLQRRGFFVGDHYVKFSQRDVFGCGGGERNETSDVGGVSDTVVVTVSSDL
jgi:hypothetical protein